MIQSLFGIIVFILVCAISAGYSLNKGVGKKGF
jgi:hypothetical protein